MCIIVFGKHCLHAGIADRCDLYAAHGDVHIVTQDNESSLACMIHLISCHTSAKYHLHSAADLHVQYLDQMAPAQGPAPEQCAQLSGAPPPAWPCYAHALNRRGNTSVKLFHYVACSSRATLRFDWSSCPERRYEAYAPPWPCQAGRGRPALAGRRLPDPGSHALQCLERRLCCSAPSWPCQACACSSHIGGQ